MFSDMKIVHVCQSDSTFPKSKLNIFEGVLYSLQKKIYCVISKSAVADHAVHNNHVINWDDAKVLCKECNARARHIHKSIWIRNRAPNTMNRDEGPTFCLICMILF